MKHLLTGLLFPGVIVVGVSSAWGIAEAWCRWGAAPVVICGVLLFAFILGVVGSMYDASLTGTDNSSECI